MSTRNLRQRVERMGPTSLQPMVIFPQTGESEASLMWRVQTAGRPVIVVPPTCTTTEEWLATYGGKS